MLMEVGELQRRKRTKSCISARLKQSILKSEGTLIKKISLKYGERELHREGGKKKKERDVLKAWMENIRKINR